MLKFVLVFLLMQNAFAGNNFNKVLVIIFENTDFKDALKQPYFSSLVKEGALATNYHALTHPSQPNYIGLIAGSTFNVRTDRNANLNQRHLGDILEDAKKDWKVYAEGFPGNCFLGSRQGNYVRKHVPFLSFINVQQNPDRCNKIVEASAFKTDFDSNQLPDFSFYVPDLQNDAHDTNISFGDRWLKQHFDAYFHSPNIPKDLLIIITFDEGSFFSDNRILTLFLGANVKKGSSTNVKYNHYSTLKTIENEFYLNSLGQNDTSASIIDDIWN
jgi:phospholipase C